MSSGPWSFTLAGFKINEIREEQGRLYVQAESMTRASPCPLCRQTSDHIHSYYPRTLKDLPIAEYTVQLDLTVPRFRCLNPGCARKTFVESLMGFAPKHAQRTRRFTDCGTVIGLALGGEAGQRTAQRLHLPLCADTLLRMIRQQPSVAEGSTFRVIGIDDWAFRRRVSYGTLIVDLEQHRPVELLADRTAETVTAWLKQHPEIEIVTRDRSTEFARGIRLGAPQGKQVADRWHLLKNLTEVLERIMTNIRAELYQLPQLGSDPNEPTIRRLEKRSKTEQKARAARRQNRLRCYEQVRALHVEGVSIKRIAEQMKLSRTTVRKLVKAEGFPEMAPHSRAGALTPFEPYLCRRWQEGCRNALQLWREVSAQGYRGTHRQVSKWVGLRREEPRRHSNIHQRAAVATPETTTPAHSMRTPATPLPSAKRLAWLLVKDQEKLDDKEQQLLQQVLQHAVAAKCHTLAHQFIRIVREHLAKELAAWLKACHDSAITEFASFADGLESDLAAVRAALETGWSNGQLEGQVNRLKLIKRQMYGRANFDLLRIRVLSTT